MCARHMATAHSLRCGWRDGLLGARPAPPSRSPLLPDVGVVLCGRATAQVQLGFSPRGLSPSCPNQQLSLPRGLYFCAVVCFILIFMNFILKFFKKKLQENSMQYYSLDIKLIHAREDFLPFYSPRSHSPT